MKKNEIRIGSTYTAKVTNRVVPVRINAENPHGGWDATNLATKKKVRIKSAAKLRGVYRDSTKPEPVTKAATPTSKATRANTAATVAKAKPKASTKAKPAKNATRANDATKTTKPNRLSGLDLAAKVLAESKEPLQAKAIAERAIAAGWKTNGKTPHATLYAAMIREIAKKGKDARFIKTDRGLFAAAPKNRKGA